MSDEIESLRRQIKARDERMASLLAHIESLTASRDRLEALTTWRPIETAPKDGTWFLGACRRSDDRWSFALVAWEDGDGYFGDVADFPVSATHWLPLPDAPGDEDRIRGAMAPSDANGAADGALKCHHAKETSDVESR